ncbi:MAG: tRNA-dihydrouridine synthase family protein [Bacteroidota bacterium]|nr:tRNA-dihydrouridine synthase family protein [Bacteroidota bacterium]
MVHEKSIISLAPIQGLTDFRFRRCFNEHFGGVDWYYAPYIRLEKGMKIPKARIRDIAPDNNQSVQLVPQIMSNKVEEMLYLAGFLEDQGYTEMNWNLGCPFPMVTNRKLGAGLLPYPDIVDGLLAEIMLKINIRLSVKLRLGLEDPHDLEKILPVLNRFSLEEIIIHPRIGKQLYKGKANRDVFEHLLPYSNHSVAYNGDLTDLADVQACQNRFPEVKHFMIGRALIANPFMAEDLTGLEMSAESKIERFKKFHDSLAEEYLSALSGPSHLLNKMRGFWEYFSLSFTNSHKVFKRIKKATSLEKYYSAVSTILTEESWVA